MPLPLESRAIGFIGSISPICFGSMVSAGSTLAFISEKSAWIVVLHGLFRMPSVSSELTLPAMAPTGKSVELAIVKSVGVKPTSVLKLESLTASVCLGLSQLGPQPRQRSIRRSLVAPGDGSPSHCSAVSNFSKHIMPPGSKTGSPPPYGYGVASGVMVLPVGDGVR